MGNFNYNFPILYSQDPFYKSCFDYFNSEKFANDIDSFSGIQSIETFFEAGTPALYPPDIWSAGVNTKYYLVKKLWLSPSATDVPMTFRANSIFPTNFNLSNDFDYEGAITKVFRTQLNVDNIMVKNLSLPVNVDYYQAFGLIIRFK